MDGLSFVAFTVEALRYAKRHPEQRLGQACFNALTWCRGGDFAGSVGKDPFYIPNKDTDTLCAWFDDVARAW